LQSSSIDSSAITPGDSVSTDTGGKHKPYKQDIPPVIKTNE